MAAVAVTNILIVLVIFIVFPVLIGVYVYRDANQRSMNATLWTLIAVLTPTLIGFIIYLLVRGSYSDLKCPSCAFAVTEQFVVCPNCGEKLKGSCPNCNIAIEPDWMVCPTCATALPLQGNGFSPPLGRNDTALRKILLFVVLTSILIALFLSIFLSFTIIGTTSSMVSSSGLVEENFNDNPEVISWINKCNEDPAKIYALSFKAEHGDDKITNYLVYRPALNANNVDNDLMSGGLMLDSNGCYIIQSGKNIDVKFHGDNSVGDIAIISRQSNKHNNLRVYVDGKKTDVVITEVEFNPISSGRIP